MCYIHTLFMRLTIIVTNINLKFVNNLTHCILSDLLNLAMESEDNDDLPDIPRYPPEPEEDHHEPDDPGPQEDEDLGPQHDEQLPVDGDQGKKGKKHNNNLCPI